MNQRSIQLFPALVYVVLFLVVPFFYLLWLSLLDKDYLYGGSASAGIHNYIEAFSNPVYRESIVNSFRLGAIVTLITLAIGFPIAYIMSVSGRLMATVLSIVTILPLFVSVVVRGFGWLIVFGREGPVNQLLQRLGVIDSSVQILYTQGAVVVALTHLLLPFMILPILASLKAIDRTVIDAAKVLGSRRHDVFIRVIIPLCAPGIIVGSLLVFLHVLASFVLPAMVGSINIKLIATMIYQQVMVAGNIPMGATLAVILFVVTIAIFASIGALKRRVKFDGKPAEVAGGA